MIVVPVSFGTWLTITVVGFAVIGLVLLPAWLDGLGRRAFTKPRQKPEIKYPDWYPESYKGFKLNWHPDKDHH